MSRPILVEGVDVRRYQMHKRHGCGCYTVFDVKYWVSCHVVACGFHEPDVTRWADL